MTWRDKCLSRHERAVLRRIEQGSTARDISMGPDQVLLADVAKRLDAAEALVSSLRREIGIKFTAREIALLHEAFGARDL